MLIKLQNNKLNNKITFRRSKESYKHGFSSIIPFHNDFIRIKPKTLWAVTALFGCLCLLSSNNVSAASVSITVTGGSSSSIDLLPTATTRDFKKSGNVQVTVSTSDASNGYTLTIADKNNDNQRLTGTSSSNYLTSITSTVTESNFSSNLTTANSTYDNKWGFLPSKLNGEANTSYQPGPKKTTATTIDVTDNPSAQTYTFAIGARVDNNQAKDTYTGTFTLAASVNATPYAIGFRDLLGNMPEVLGGTTTGTSVTIPNLSSNLPTKPGYTFKGWCKTATTNNLCNGSTTPDIPIAGGSYNLSDGAVKDLYAMWEEKPITIYDMQSVSTWKSGLKNGDIVTVRDTRDNRLYKAGKMKDGKIWMLDNLAFNGKNSQGTGSYVTLTSDNTNVANSITPDSSWNWASGESSTYTAPKISTANLGNIPTDTVSTNGGFDSGAYYNYCAASAKTVCESSYSSAPDSSHDICPKGWHLPSGGTSDTADFRALYLALGGTGTSSSDSTFYNTFRDTLHLPLSGRYLDGSFGSFGSGGNFWSSTYLNSTNMFRLILDTSVVNPQSTSSRLYGYSVRCVTAGS